MKVSSIRLCNMFLYFHDFSHISPKWQILWNDNILVMKDYILDKCVSDNHNDLQNVKWTRMQQPQGLVQGGVFVSETNLESKSRENLFAHYYILNSPIVLMFCTGQGSDTSVFAAKLRQDWTIERNVMDERRFARFEFNVSFGRISHIAQHLWAPSQYPTSNGSWRQGIKGEMTCTVYVALVWNIIYWIMMIITLFTE